jgi:HSP20 family molecular chaperone IbpA
MQVDFPRKHSSTRFSQSSGYTSSRKLDNRRIPIINSRDSPILPEPHSIYKFPQSMNNKSSTYDEQTTVETHRRRSSPTTGLQSSYNIEHHRSTSPALSHIAEEESDRSLTPSSHDSSIFPQDFNSEIFYQSVFQPEIFTDDRHQRYIELKLDVHDYNPDDMKISINDNDLIVQVEKSNFYKKITVPSNIESTSLTVHHHHDKKLYITIKLLDEHSSFKYI